MFGFGAFDSNPENANNFNDEVAVVGLTNQTIIGNKMKPSRSKMTKLKNLRVGLSIHQQMVESTSPILLAQEKAC